MKYKFSIFSNSPQILKYVFLFLIFAHKSFGLDLNYPPLPQYGVLNIMSSSCSVAPVSGQSSPIQVTWNVAAGGYGVPGVQYNCTGNYNIKYYNGNISTCAGSFSTYSNPLDMLSTDFAGNLNPGWTPENLITNNSNMSCTTDGSIGMTDPTTFAAELACNIPSGANLNVPSNGSETTCHTTTMFAYFGDLANAYKCTVNLITGALTNCAVVVQNGSLLVFPSAIGILPAGTFAYIADQNKGAIVCNYNTSSGNLTSCATTAFTTATLTMAIAPSGAFIYFSTTGGAIAFCAVNAGTGALSGCTNLLTGITNLWGIAVDPSNTHLYYTDQTNVFVCPILGGGTIGACSQTATTGSPPADPLTFYFNSSGTVAYILNAFTAPTITQCAVGGAGSLINCSAASNGASTISPNTPFEGQGLDPFNNFGYAGDQSGFIWVCPINEQTGNFTNCFNSNPSNPFVVPQNITFFVSTS